MQTRKLVAEMLGTAILVFFAVGVATLSLGFKFAGSSTSAGSRGGSGTCSTGDSG